MSITILDAIKQLNKLDEYKNLVHNPKVLESFKRTQKLLSNRSDQKQLKKLERI